MTNWGYTLSSEEHHPSDLVRLAIRAEEAGFDFLSISDHYHPWISEQGHAPFVWSTVGAVAAVTERIRLGVGVTCPIVRIHPAVIAQAVASCAAMFERSVHNGSNGSNGSSGSSPSTPGRFFFGVGTGEALNEHITGERWPPVQIRRDMLSEAVAIMRALWAGGSVTFEGDYFVVDNAKLFTLPQRAPAVIVSAFGPAATDLAAEIGDGFWTTAPAKELLDRFTANGGQGPKIGQITVCFDDDADQAVKIAHRVWPNTGLPGQLAQDLPTWTHFEQAATLVTPEMVASAMPCGPDPDAIVEAVMPYLDAGFDHLYFHQVGPNQDGFLSFWERELAPRLAQLS